MIDELILQAQNKSWPPGFCVNPRKEIIPQSLCELFKGVPVSNISDCMGRNYGTSSLRSFHSFSGKDMKLCGRAITVKTRPGDNLMLHIAILMAKEGDVIVVDGAGDLSVALIGGLMRESAIARKLGGFVVDGAIRDLAEWHDGKLPVFARGVCLKGPSKEGPGEINVPISCAGMIVNAGDVIVADSDGIVAIPALRAIEVYEDVRQLQEREEYIRRNNRQGQQDINRFLHILRAKNCPI